jgi:hypothetical protein
MNMNTRTNNKRQVAGILVASAMILGSAVAQAQMQTISLNFKQYAAVAPNDVLDGYGVVSANNWINLQTSMTGTDLITSSGALSTVDLSGSSPGGYNTWNTGTLNYTPMRSGAGTYGTTYATGPSMTLSQLNGTFSSYDLIVYVAGYAGKQGQITDGTTTFYYTVPNPFSTSLTLSTDIDKSNGVDVGTYVRFSGLSADTVTISLCSVLGNGVGIGGFQIVGAAAVPEPSSAVTLLLGAGVFAVIRRRRSA